MKFNTENRVDHRKTLQEMMLGQAWGFKPAILALWGQRQMDPLEFLSSKPSSLQSQGGRRRREGRGWGKREEECWDNGFSL